MHALLDPCRYADAGFTTNTTNVRLARLEVPVTRQQPTVGKMIPLAQKWGARVRPSAMLARANPPSRLVLEAEIRR
jgi:hypothetical protein